MKKIISIASTILLCFINLLIMFYFVNKNETNIFSLIKNNQARSLYQVSINANDNNIEDFTSYIKSLKVSSNENWYIYDTYNNNFILYKDKTNQKIDESVKNFFASYTQNTESIVINDEDNNEMILSLKQFEIDSNKYIIGISEYTSAILNSVNNQNFNVYLYGETIILSLFIIVLVLTLNISYSDRKKEIDKINSEFSAYKARFIESDSTNNKEEEIIEDTKPIQNENGEYTLHFIDLLVPALQNNGILYNIYNISELKFWIIEEFIKDDVYKIRKDKENLIILLINGTEKQKKLLEEFEQ